MNAKNHLKSKVFELVEMTSAEWQDFISRWTEFELNKNEMLISAGQVERYFYFIHDGVLRAYFSNEGVESCVGFSYNGDYSGAYDSFLEQKPTDWMIQSLSKVTGLKISYSDLMELFDRYKSVERWGRLFNARILIGIGRRQVEVRDFSAEERFKRLMQDSPHIFQLVPQKHLASYLGMKPETFSRMRKIYLKEL